MPGGWSAVRVVGPSMEPAVRNGDWWVVRAARVYRPGDVVALRHPHRPDLLVVKRIIRIEADGTWVEGDNWAASEDSRAFGAVPATLLVGRLVLRYRRGPRGPGR